MKPTPLGVPVSINVPGSRVKQWDRYETIRLTGNIKSEVLESCMTFPSRRQTMSRLPGSRSVTMLGPVGQKVSWLFARAHWPSENWTARFDISFAAVQPRMNSSTLSSGTFLALFPHHDCHLRLVVYLIGILSGQDDRVSRAAQRGGRLYEDQGFGWQRMVGFSGVRPVIQPDADNVRRIHRRQELHFVKIQDGGFADKPRKWRTGTGMNVPVIDDAVVNMLFMQISDDPHQ